MLRLSGSTLRRQRPLSLLTAVLVLLGILVSWPLSAQESCQSVQFVPSDWPDWVNAALWEDESEQQLLIVDPFSYDITRFNLDGWADTLTHRFSSLEGFRPIAFSRTKNGLAIQLDRNRFVESTIRGQRIEISTLALSSAREPTLSSITGQNLKEQIEKLWQWALTKPVQMSQQEVIAFAEVFHGGARNKVQNWTFGFIRYPLDQPNQFKVLQRQTESGEDLPKIDNLKHPIRNAFRLSDTPLIAAVGTTAYVLVVEEKKPRIYVNVEGSSSLLPVRLSGLLPGLDRSPDLSFGNIGNETFEAAYPDILARMEAMETYGGLFSTEKTLFYLSRRPRIKEEGAGTVWSLTALQPSEDSPQVLRVLGSTEISGLAAPHLTVAVGEKRWAFIEKKRPGTFYLRQEIPGMYVVPATEIAKVASKRTPRAICAKSTSLSVEASP